MSLINDHYNMTRQEMAWGKCIYVNEGPHNLLLLLGL